MIYYAKLAITAIAMGFSLIMLGASWVKEDVESNSLGGFHCQPITEHKTLESAKAQVDIYHSMVRG